MGELTIITNHVPRDVVYAYELTPAERAEFDYIRWDEVEDGAISPEFVRYKGELYDLDEFQVWDNPDSPTQMGWDGFLSDSYFSGLVIRWVPDTDFEEVVVGRYYS